MAVYDHAYKGYFGQLNPGWSRFLVMARYSLADVFKSRVFLAFFVACFIGPLSCGSLIYLHYNFEALSILDLPIDQLLKIDGAFFRTFFLRPQLMAATALILIVGPALVSPDLRNNALPLYLSRPMNKRDYVLGKLLVLLIITSAVTWIPGLILFFLQSGLAGIDWFTEHIRVAFALVIASFAYILPLSLLSLAVSAWVKWKPWARVFFLGLIFVSAAVGGVFSGLFESWLGTTLMLVFVIERIMDSLFGLPSDLSMPVAVAWGSMFLLGFLSTVLLFRRIKAFEVVS